MQDKSLGESGSLFFPCDREFVRDRLLETIAKEVTQIYCDADGQRLKTLVLVYLAATSEMLKTATLLRKWLQAIPLNPSSGC